MRTATLRLEDMKTTIINMGYVGENEHKQIRFDGKKMFQEYPNASVSLTVCPVCGEAYPATIERDGDFVLWTITDSDLVAEGCGEIQLTFTESPHIAKSYICRTNVLRSLVPTGDIPSGLDDFITRADALLEELEDAIPEGGTTRQVLAKKSNTDYDTEWVDQGGGTEDYDELENRPQIGGVTLTGNKTLHDLGAATEEAVGAKYTKPSGGIPASDLAAGVIPDPEALIDDTAGAGDTDKVWSADKSSALLTEINSAPSLKNSEEIGPDLDISDNYGNVIGRFVGGGFVVKEFDGRKFTTYSKSAAYTVGQELTITINQSFNKGDRIVLHTDTGLPPWTSGGRVAYYTGDVQVTASTWRGAETWFEYQLKKNVNTVTAVLPTNALYENATVTFEVSHLGEVPITPKVVTIKKDGTGDFTNLKACLADIAYKANDVLNPYRIEIYPGTYDVLEDYTAEEMAQIYEGQTSINQYSQTSFVGPKLLNGMSLIGMGRPEDVVLTAYLDPAPTDDLSKRQRGQISTLNLQGSGSIENLTIIAQNMRYCVHDDFSAPLGKKCKRVVKNCVFRGYNIAYGPHTTYGAGMPQGGMDFLFVGCDFGEDVGVHTQSEIYDRPEIHLIDCKGHSFRIGDDEMVDPITDYTVYRLENCNFLDVRQAMKDTVPHVILRGSGGSSPFYQLDPNTMYNTGDTIIVPLDVLGTALTVGTCVEMYNDNASGPRFKAITALANFAGIVVYVDDDNTYIQTKGYVRTDRLGLTTFNNGDYVGLNGTACAVVVSASDAFGKIVYVDNESEGYVKIGGAF